MTTLNSGKEAFPSEINSCAFGNSSTNEMYIITPAENPNAVVRNSVFVRFEKNAMALPMEVLNPAKTVRASAKRKFDDSIKFIVSQRLLCRETQRIFSVLLRVSLRV
jgi:hypothetical protein